MRKRVKITLWVVVVLMVVGGILLHLSRERILHAVTVGLIAEITGFGVELADLDVNLRRRTLEFTDLKLINPEPFPATDAIHLSRVFAALSWDALLGKRSWLTRLDLEIASLHLIRPREGISNLEVLGKNAEAWESAQESGREPADAPQARELSAPVQAGWGMPRKPLTVAGSDAGVGEPDLQIDELRIWIGEVHVIDHKLGRFEPVTFSSTLDREKTYHGVTDLDALGEELAIDFGVDALLGQFSELDEAFPGLSNGVKDLLKQMNTPGTQESEALEDAVDLFRDALDEFSN